MKPIKSKSQEREEIEHQMRHFLRHGGQVTTIAPGISGRELGSYRLPPVIFHGDKGQGNNSHASKTSRTPLLEQVRAIEARKTRHNHPHNTLAPIKPKGPRKVLITDDFGEPLRWRWQDS